MFKIVLVVIFTQVLIFHSIMSWADEEVVVSEDTLSDRDRLKAIKAERKDLFKQYKNNVAQLDQEFTLLLNEQRNILKRELTPEENINFSKDYESKKDILLNQYQMQVQVLDNQENKIRGWDKNAARQQRYYKKMRNRLKSKKTQQDLRFAPQGGNQLKFNNKVPNSTKERRHGAMSPKDLADSKRSLRRLNRRGSGHY